MRSSAREKRMRRLQAHLFWMSCAFATCALAGPAHAFSDPLAYSDEVLVGGGGGRWFTGSTADGFGCEVCHEGGPTADLSIAGLPLDGFEPGASYEITVGWSASAEHVALVAELTDEARTGVGELELPRPDATPETERCSGELLGAPSSALHEVEAGARRLVSVIDCGARQVRFLWSVPATAPEAVWLHVGFVASNSDTTPSGDGVTMARRLLLRKGISRDARVIAKGCSTGPRSHDGSLKATWTWLGLALFVLLCLWTRRGPPRPLEER